MKTTKTTMFCISVSHVIQMDHIPHLLFCMHAERYDDSTVIYFNE